MDDFEQRALEKIYQITREEDEKFLQKQTKRDQRLAKHLLKDMHQFGYPFDSLADLVCRNVADARLIPLVKKYIKQFDNPIMNLDLLKILSIKGCKEATPLVIDFYAYAKEQNMDPNQFYVAIATSVDYALWRIKDKSYMDTYKQWFANPFDFLHLPCTMEMLVRWNKQDPYLQNILIAYLQRDTIKIYGVTTKIKPLYLMGIMKDEALIPYIEPFLTSDDACLRELAQKAIERIRKKPVKRTRKK